MSALSFPAACSSLKIWLCSVVKHCWTHCCILALKVCCIDIFFPVRINKNKKKNPPQTNSLTCSPCETQPPLSMSAVKQQNALSSALFLVSLETTPWISVKLFFPVAVNTYISLFPRALERIRLSCGFWSLRSFLRVGTVNYPRFFPPCHTNLNCFPLFCQLSPHSPSLWSAVHTAHLNRDISVTLLSSMVRKLGFQLALIN